MAAFVVAASVGFTLVAAPAGATTVSVANETEYRDALTALSGDNSGPHTIEVTADFTLVTAGDPTYSGTQPLTINGNGHTINGGGAHRIIDVTSLASPSLTVNAATLTNAFTSSFGGAIRSTGPVTVTNSSLSGNTAGSLGGAGIAMWFQGDVTVTNSTVSGNTANAPSGLNLGAIAVLGPIGDITVTNSTVSGNTITTTDAGFGAGISQGAPGDITVTNSTVSGNTANAPTAFGGGISTGGSGTITLTNSTVSGNTASGTDSRGGGVFLGSSDATLSLTYATLASNTAQTGANAVSSNDLASYGSVFADPLGGGANCQNDGTVTSNGYNYSTDASCGLTGTGDTQSGADPQLLALGSYGGPTHTRPPEVTSPLVDAIPSAACDPSFPTDQRGEVRPADGNGDGVVACDIGAVELQPVPPAPTPAPEPAPAPAPAPTPAATPVTITPRFTG